MRTRILKSATASAAAVTLATVAAAVPTATAGTAEHTPSNAVTWEPCPEQVTVTTAECGRVDVPMYHADPEGEQISVGFVRIPAADQDARRGALFTNPGGPGGDGYSFVGYDGDGAFDWPAEMTDEWDLIAVQPRGLPGSTPVDCNHEPAGYDPVRMELEYGGYVKAACEAGTPGYTDALNSWETAHDWESVRSALDEERISILGLSYGTQLGSNYATLFPERTDRLVLDSGYSPDRAWNGVIADQTGGYIGALHDFLEWTAANNETYGLGETPLEVYRAWSRVVVEESGTNPTVVPPPAQIGDLPDGLQWAGQPAADALTAVGGPQAQLEGLFRQLTTPGAIQAASPTLAMTRMTVPQPDQWGELAEMINGTSAGISQEELTEQMLTDDLAVSQNMQLMVMCNENQVAPDLTAVPDYILNAYLVGDPFALPGAIYASGAACSGIEPNAPFVDIDGSALDVQPLQIQGTGDPQTVYRTHGPMAEAMGSHVITVDGPGHGQVGFGNTVVDDAVVDYLRTGTAELTAAPSRPVG